MEYQMMLGFLVWTAVALLVVGIGIWSWRSETPAVAYTFILAKNQ